MSLEQFVWGTEFPGRAHLMDVERGRSSPTLTSCAKFARTLEVELFDLINFPEMGLRQRLIEVTRCLDQDALARLLAEAERLLQEDTTSH